METFRELNECLHGLGFAMLKRHEILANYKIQYLRTWAMKEVYKFHIMARREQVIVKDNKKFKSLAKKMADRSQRVMLERVCNGEQRKQNTKYDTGLAKATA